MTRAAYWHAGGSWPLTAETVDERFRAVVAEHRDRDCLVGVATGRRLSYAATDRETQRIARGLIGLGVTRGHRVGVWATNHVEWVLVQLATARIGAVLVNVNPAYRVGELEYALNLAQVQTLITMPGFRRSDYVAMVSALCPEASVLAAPGLSCARLPSLRHVVLFDPGDLPPVRTVGLGGSNRRTSQDRARQQHQ